MLSVLFPGAEASTAGKFKVKGAKQKKPPKEKKPKTPKAAPARAKNHLQTTPFVALPERTVEPTELDPEGRASWPNDTADPYDYLSSDERSITTEFTTDLTAAPESPTSSVESWDGTEFARWTPVEKKPKVQQPYAGPRLEPDDDAHIF